MQAFLPARDKRLERTNKEGDGEVGDHQLNEMGSLTMKQKEGNKLDRGETPHRPAISKHGSSLQSHLELWADCVVKKFQDNSDMRLDFKSDSKFFY